MPAYNDTVELIVDIKGRPISQIYNVLTGQMEPWQGSGNAGAYIRGKFYQVGASATTNTIPMLSSSGLTLVLSSATQSQLTGAKMEIVIGSELVEAIVTEVSASGTLTLDSALPSAPAQGTYFLLCPPEQTQLAGGLVTLASGVTATGAQTAQSIGGAYSLLRLNVWVTGTSPAFDVQVQGQMYDGEWYELEATNSVTDANVGTDITTNGVYDYDIASWVMVRMNVVSLSGTNAAVSAQGGLHQ